MRSISAFILTTALLVGSVIAVRAETVSVPLFIHIIQPTEVNLVSDKQIVDQMNYLNSTVDNRMVFLLDGVERVISPDWFSDLSKEMEMKKALSRDGMKVIDIYLVGPKGMNDKGIWGETTMPFRGINYPFEDGCVILYTAITGGDAGMPGDVMAHELGHSLGLDDIYKKTIFTCSDLMYGVADNKPCKTFTFAEVSATILSCKKYR